MDGRCSRKRALQANSFLLPAAPALTKLCFRIVLRIFLCRHWCLGGLAPLKHGSMQFLDLFRHLG